MIRKELINKQVVRAISLGLSAVMLTTPMTAMAAEGDGGETAKGETEPSVEAVKAEVESVVDGAQEAADFAVEATVPAQEKEDKVVNMVSPTGPDADPDAGVKAGEAGIVSGVDLAQEVIDASDAVAANTGITEAATDITNADIQLDSAEDNITKADGNTKVAETAADAATDAAAELTTIVNEANAVVDEKTDAIQNATSIGAANAAYDEMEEAVKDAQAEFDAKVAEYDAAKAAFDAAAANVKAAEAAYETAVKLAGVNADEAAKELEDAKAAAAALEEAVIAAKAAVDTSAADAMAIAAAEDVAVNDGTLSWSNQDKLFIAMMEKYYLANKDEYKDKEIKVTRVKGIDGHNYNYFTVTVDGVEQDVYYNYKMEDGSKDKIVIFEKRAVEVAANDALKNGKEVENPDQYVDENGKVISVDDFNAGVTAGTIQEVDGQYVQYDPATGEFKELINSSEITSTSTEDVTVGEKSDATYRFDVDGNLVKEVTADVTTVTYSGKTLESGNVYATDAERDAAAAAKEAELEANGKDATVTETEDTVTTYNTTYTAKGTYIPVFTDVINVNTIEDTWGGKSDAIDEVYDDKTDKYDNEEKYYKVNITDDLTAYRTDDGLFIDDYRVTGTINATYMKVEKKTVDLTTLEAFASNIGFSDKKEKTKEAVKKAIEAEGGIFVDFESFNWDFTTATYWYVQGYEVETGEYATEAEAKAALNAAAAEAAKKQGASSANDVKFTETDSETEEIKTTTYGYKVDYFEKTGEVTENKVVESTTYSAEGINTLKGEVIQNLNYLNDAILLTQDDADFRAFVDDAKTLTGKYDELLKAADAADAAVADAQARVDALQKAIDDIEREGNLEALKALQAELDEATAQKEAAEDVLDEIIEKLGEAEEILDGVIDRLTPDPTPTDDGDDDGDGGDDTDDTDDEGTDDTTPAVVTIEAEGTPLAATPTVAAGTVVDDANVTIEDEATPLADGLSGDDVIVAEAEENDQAIVAIEDEETPLAPSAEEKAKMSWWWLLIIAILGATGYKMYKDHQKKKEEAAGEA